MTPINFSNLEKKSKDLNRHSDELTSTLARIEEKVNSLNLGIEVFLSAPLTETYQSDEPEQADRICTSTRLGYGKNFDKWCLLLKETESREWLDNSGEFDHDQEISNYCYPLLSASRKLRMAAVDQIPKLIAALESEADKLQEAVAKANEIATEL